MPLLLFLLDVLTDHTVHRVQQRRLLDAETLGEFTEIGGAQDLVRDDGDALHDATDGLRALHGVNDTVHRQTCLKRDEVRGVFLNMLLELRSGVFATEGIRVITVRQ